METRNIADHAQFAIWKWGKSGNKVRIYRSISKKLCTIWVAEVHFESNLTLNELLDIKCLPYDW